MRSILSKLLFAALAAQAAIALPAAAQPDAAAAAGMVAVRLAPGETIRLDGSLSDPAWRRAPVFRDFVEKDPKTGARPGHETLVQVLYDDQAVYVGITALDPDPRQIRAPLVRHDAVIRTQDFVVVYFDPIGSRRSAQFFRVNAAGSTADGMHTANDDSEDFSPDFDFDAAARRDERGYTVVLRVPFAALRFAGEGQGTDGWRIMVGRRVPREQFHLHTSVLIPNDAPSFIATLQPLNGIALPKESGFLTLRPSVTLRRESAQEAGAARHDSVDIRPTLDLKWRPLPELVIDGTLKPDFSQIDLDVPQLGGNSRYALYYPEKRPFFFEASDLLRSPTDALYTRSFTAPKWGLRATWRGQVHAGTAIAADDRGGGLVLLPGAYGTEYADQPASRTLAVRQLSDHGRFQVGGILAARRYDRGRGDNVVLGPDLAWQASDRLRLRAQWLHSHTTAQPDGHGDLARGRAADGDRVYFRAVHQADTEQADITIDDIDRGFRHDSGFVNQAGVRLAETHYGKGWRNRGPFNELWINLDLNHARDRATGETIKTEFIPSLWFSSPGNTEAELALHGFTAQRAAPGGRMLREKYVYGSYSTTPAIWFPLVEASFSAGRLADVVADAVRPGARFNLMARMRALPQLELEPSLSWAGLRRDGLRSYREAVAQLKGIWFFNAEQNLRLIVQRTTLDRLPEPGVDEERDRSRVASLTYTWRRSAGTVLYLGASRSTLGAAAPSRASEVFAKLQFDVDEIRRAF
ncbi:MAG TPA: carbohydrate binding family 9 domain-containing protein [Paucimonas sp.]|nr:carbohydrate binding family 9 domain-containing protein [Paucimonas sp.]